MSKSEHCYVTLLTPPGRSAVATIGLYGHEAASYLEAFFSPAHARSLSSRPLQCTVFGRWRSTVDSPGEEVVVCRVSAQRWEIHCHGGAAAADAILSALQTQGCVALKMTKFWTHCEVVDATSTTALELLAQCRTQRSAALLLDQARGAWRAARDELCALLHSGDWETALVRIERLLSLYTYVEHSQRPFRVVIVGAPNVGKSSLINALVGYDRAIVFDQPGTTRDVVSATTALDGWLFEFSDTAGMRETTDEIEASGIQRVQQTLALADLVIQVRDATRPAEPLPELPSVARQFARLEIWNKCDLLSPPEAAAGLRISAATKQGICELQNAVLATLCPQPPLPGEAVPLEFFDYTMLLHFSRHLRDNNHDEFQRVFDYAQRCWRYSEQQRREWVARVN